MATTNNSANIVDDIRNQKNWKRTHKKNYEVYVCMPPIGTKVHNFLEGTDYVTTKEKRFVISGTRGEQWVIDAAKLAKTYQTLDGQPLNTKTLNIKNGIMPWVKVKTRPDASIVWACFLPKKYRSFPVKTSWGDVLMANRPEVRHGYGDFLVCADANGRPNFSDMWVVNGEVFPTTYDLRSFPNMFSDEQMDKLVTPTPKKFAVTQSDNKKATENVDRRRKNFILTKKIKNNREIIRYEIKQVESGKVMEVTKEQMYFLVGAGRIENCKGQIVNDRKVEVALMGKNGESLINIPSVQVEETA